LILQAKTFDKGELNSLQKQLFVEEGRTSFFMDVVLQCHGYRMIQKTLLVLAIDWRIMLIRFSYILNIVWFRRQCLWGSVTSMYIILKTYFNVANLEIGYLLQFWCILLFHIERQLIVRCNRRFHYFEQWLVLFL
jgi:hypothetical protein